MDALYTLADDPDGPFKARSEALRKDITLVERAAHNTRAQESGAAILAQAQDILSEFDTLVMRARDRIKIAIDTVLTETKDSLNGVLVTGIPQLRAYLELAAAGNLLAEVAAMQAETDRAASEAVAAIEQGRVWMITFAVGSLVGAVLLAWLSVGRTIVTRIQRLADAMRTIAGGHLDEPIPQGGSDEITDMAEALVVFRDTARHAAEATARTEAERVRATEERRRMLSPPCRR